MVMKKTLFSFMILLASLSLQAQEERLSWSAEVVSEGQWSMSGGGTRWMNVFNAGVGVELWRGALFDATALSTYGAGSPVAADRMGFSNIDAENNAFRLFHAGLSQNFFNDRLSVFVGLKAADEDYFNTSLSGLFTGSAYGAMPTFTESHAIAVYPEAALALHLEYTGGNWTLRETLYNGAPSDKIDEQFRFRPGRDGLFNIGSVMYAVESDEVAPASYTLGYAVTTKEARGHNEFGVWGSVEQPVCNVGRARVNVLAQASKNFARTASCKGFWAGGVVAENVTKNGGQLGFSVCRIYCIDGNETDAEITFNCPVGAGFSIQPAVHAIRTDGESNIVGLLRLCYEIGN